MWLIKKLDGITGLRFELITYLGKNCRKIEQNNLFGTKKQFTFYCIKCFMPVRENLKEIYDDLCYKNHPIRTENTGRIVCCYCDKNDDIDCDSDTCDCTDDSDYDHN